MDFRIGSLLPIFGVVFTEVLRENLDCMLEHFLQCPYCWQNISMLLDTSISAQDYIEDCENCCNPIRLRISFEYGELVAFEAINIEQ